jgi:hypothetical protein
MVKDRESTGFTPASYIGRNFSGAHGSQQRQNQKKEELRRAESAVFAGFFGRFWAGSTGNMGHFHSIWPVNGDICRYCPRIVDSSDRSAVGILGSDSKPVRL